MNAYLDELWNHLEAAWDLAMKVNDLPEEQRGDVKSAWESVFKPSEIVDVSKTEEQGQNPPLKVFCRSIYGIQFNDKTKYWVPFRHGEIDLARFTADD